MRLLLLLLTFFGSCVAELDAQPRVSTGWSIPLILGEDAKSMLQAPCLAVSPDTVYVLGSTAPNFDGEVAPTLHMVRAARDRSSVLQTPVEAPPAAQYPQCLFSQDGALHVVWAEIPPSVTFTTEYIIHAPILAHNVYENGQWQRMGAHDYGYDVTWSWARLIRGPDGAFYAAINFREQQGADIDIVRIDPAASGESWYRDPLGFGGGYPQIAFSSEGKPLLAYTAGARAEPTSKLKTDVNSVFFDDLDGEHDSVLVSRSGMNPADYLRMAVTSDGIVHLVWVRARAGAADQNDFWAGSFVYHTFSEDGGVTWTAPEPVTPLLNIATVYLLEGPDGDLHLVAEAATDDWGNTLYYTHYDDMIWTDTQRIFTDGLTADVALTVTEDGTLHLFTNHLAPGSPPEAYRPVYLARPPQR